MRVSRPALLTLLLGACYPSIPLEKDPGFGVDTGAVTGDEGGTDVTDDTAAGGDGGGADGADGAGDGGADGAGDGGSDGGTDGGGADGGGPVGAAPTCTISRPSDGDADDYTEGIELRGAAADDEDGDLSASIAWTSDLEGALGTGDRVDVTPTVSGTHTITCAVTDSDGNTATDSVQYTVISPLVEVTRPDDGDTFDEGDRVRLRCDASDLEDGDLDGNSVVWTSDRDGTIDTSCEVDTRQLSRGDHVLTVTATDSDGNTASDSIEITIQRD